MTLPQYERSVPPAADGADPPPRDHTLEPDWDDLDRQVLLAHFRECMNGNVTAISLWYRRSDIDSAPSEDDEFSELSLEELKELDAAEDAFEKKYPPQHQIDRHFRQHQPNESDEHE